MKDILKLGLILALFASVSCVVLSLVNNVTSPVIEERKEKEAVAGMKIVFPDADSFTSIKDFDRSKASSVSIDNFVTAKDSSGNTLGCVIQVTGATYDKATILIGVDSDRKITAIKFLSLSDTPGFGQKANEPSWYSQFCNKSIKDNFTVNEDVVAISKATITSKGVANILKQAVSVVDDYFNETMK